MASSLESRAPSNVGGAEASLNNPDLAPVPADQRTWGRWNFAAIWLGMVHNIFGFTVVGSLMASGLSAMQALVSVFITCLIQFGFLVLTGRVGSRFGIPFPVWARSAFGLRGTNIPAILRGINGVIWFGIQNFLGGSVLNVLFGQVSPQWKSMGDTVFFGLGLDLWLSLAAFWIISFLVVRHGVDTIRRFESWAGPSVLIVMLGLVVWAIDAGDGLGPVFAASSSHETPSAFVAYGLVPAVVTFMNAGFITMILNYPDITRFASSNREQSIGTLIGLPFGTFLYYGMAAIIVSGTEAATGEVLWNPADVLAALNMPIVTIIGAILLTVATMSVNVVSNLVSPAYDLCNLFPKVFNFRRAAAVSILASFVWMPWHWMSNPAGIFDLVDNFGLFLGPATGVLLADFFILRKQKLVVPDLYSSTGVYRYHNGFNWVALGTLGVVTAALLVVKFTDSIDSAYKYSWFIGVAASMVLYTIGMQVARLAPAVAARHASHGTATYGAEGQPVLATVTVEGSSAV